MFVVAFNNKHVFCKCSVLSICQNAVSKLHYVVNAPGRFVQRLWRNAYTVLIVIFDIRMGKGACFNQEGFG